MVTHPTNLQLLRPSRRRLAPGDVFTMRLLDDSYIFGRIIKADLGHDEAPMPGSNLVYIYNHRSPLKEPAFGALRPDRLLIPPQFTNRIGWSRGYFETVAHRTLEPADRLPQHCFWRVPQQRYVDLDGTPLDGPTEPCGIWGLGNYRIIEDEVCQALNIPLAPE
jgi:hypothetical protein